MPRFDYLDRITYGPNKGGYDYNGNGWTGHFYRLAKDNELGLWELTILNAKTEKVIDTRRYEKVTDADRYIGSLVNPLKRARQAEWDAERKAAAREQAERVAREKDERLSRDSHRDSDVYIKSKITRQEAIKLAERLLHWAVDTNKNEPLDARCIDLNIYYTDSTRGAGWRQDEDDNRYSIGIGWHSSDDIYPVIEDSLIAKRKQPEPVSEDDDLAAAV